GRKASREPSRSAQSDSGGGAVAMKHAQLLAYFDRLAEAPDAIPRLRRFILDIAVRGKLVEQDANDEPASDLFKRIQAYKLQLLITAQARRQKPHPSLPDNEIPFCLPTNWKWCRLAEIGFINPRNTAENSHPASFMPMTLMSAEYGIP